MKALHAFKSGGITVSVRHTARVFLPALILAAALCAADVPATLQVSNTTVPAGAMAQIRVSLSAPQAIASGAFSMDFDPALFGDIADVQMFSAAGDVIGVASIKGRHVDVQFTSASGGVGRLPGLPAATVAIPVLPEAAAGATAAITIDPSARPWKDPNGAVFALAVQPGSVTAGGSFTIQNVTPGGGLQPAGSVIRVEGSGFRPDTAIEMPGVALAATVYVSPTEIDMTLGGSAEVTGKLIRATNPNGAIADYVSSLRGIPSEPSAARVQPLFPLRTYSSIVDGPLPSSRGGRRAIALENQNVTAVDVQLEIIDIFGGLSGRKAFSLPPGGILLQDIGALGLIYGDRVGVLPSQPIRAVALATPTYFPAGPPSDLAAAPVASETSPDYTKFQIPDDPLQVSPGSLSFRSQAGVSVPNSNDISVSSKVHSFEDVNYTASAITNTGGTWLSVTPLQGSAAKSPTLTAKVDSTALTPGIYTGTITVTPSVQGSKPLTIPVTVTVSAQPFIISLGVTDYFNLAPGAASAPPQSISVLSTGNPAPLAISAKTDSGGNWLSLASTTATTPAKVGFSVNPAGLPIGNYQGTISIQGPSNTLAFTIRMIIAVPPVLKLVSLNPASLNLSYQAGALLSPVIASVVVNSLGAPFTVAASTEAGGNWLLAERTAANGIDVKVDTSSLAAGTYTGVVTATATNGTGALTLPVKLMTWSGVTPPLTLNPSSLMLTGDTDLVPFQSFTVSSGGVPLDVAIKSDMPPDSCDLSAGPEQSGVLAQALTPTKVSVSCTGGPGDYSGTITVTAGSNSVVVPVTVHIAPGPYHGLITPPIVGAIVNAASSATGPVAPGEILTIHGTGVGTRDPAGLAFDPSGAVSRNLNGLRVLFDGTPAPLIYTSLFQTNLIVPYEIANRQTTSIQVDAGGSLSAPIVLPVAAAAPALFTIGSSGIGPAAVLNEDNSVNSPSNPAARGSIIQIYATGEGQTTPAGITGSVTHSATKKPVLPAGVTIGGIDAQVMYAGSAPEAVSGLFQVNAMVPQSAQAGPAVPLVLKIGDSQSSSGVTIAIQ
jgi:uncharacterized protein (TIGR03437 family)